ncbi:MAG: AIR synthase related protein, partial [Terriglobales bacterium]
MGIGDDAALVRPRPGWELALTTDLFLEGVHFRRDRDAAPVCGRRLATRALSDLAAMGAQPLALLVSFAAPATLPRIWARGLMRGLLAAAAAAGAALIGGDSSAATTVLL